MNNNKNLLIALGVIITLAILIFLYYIITGKKMKEMFIDNSDLAYNEVISTIFKTYLLRPPQPLEISKIRKKMRNPNDVEVVTKEVKNTSEYTKLLDATENSRDNLKDTHPTTPTEKSPENKDIADIRVEKLPVQKRTELYRLIIDIYDTNLRRMPNMRELNYYTARMVSDETFNHDKLKIILQSSKEYEIIQKNQTNVVHAELPFNVTDSQLSHEVEEIYKSTLQGKQSKSKEEGNKESEEDDIKIPMELFKFLKYKYKDFELNAQRLRELIVLLHQIDSKNVNMEKIIHYEQNQPQTFDKKKFNSSSYETFTDQGPKMKETTDTNNTKEKSRDYGDFSSEYFQNITPIIRDELMDALLRSSVNDKEKKNEEEESESESDSKQEDEDGRNTQETKKQKPKPKRTFVESEEREEGPLNSNQNLINQDAIKGMDFSDKEAIKNIKQVRNENLKKFRKNRMMKEKESNKKGKENKEKKEGNVRPANTCATDPYKQIADKYKEYYESNRNGLAYLQFDRNVSELDDICNRNNYYLNANDDMVLFPEFKWSVPQPRAPVCVDTKPNNYQPSVEQTALIGTLLSDT